MKIAKISLNKYILALFGLMALQGCSIGWYSSREGGKEFPPYESTAWSCPENFELNVSSSQYTNTQGEKASRPEYISDIREQLSNTTEKILKDFGCLMSESPVRTAASTLVVNVRELKYLSALPQEWLTGLSFGLIPSWGTRPEKWKFEFVQGSYTRSFVVDDTRFNHLAVTPFFWLTFFLRDINSEYAQALREFTSNAL